MNSIKQTSLLVCSLFRITWMTWIPRKYDYIAIADSDQSIYGWFLFRVCAGILCVTCWVKCNMVGESLMISTRGS